VFIVDQNRDEILVSLHTTTRGTQDFNFRVGLVKASRATNFGASQ
jgi:hypothetical protein